MCCCQRLLRQQHVDSSSETTVQSMNTSPRTQVNQPYCTMLVLCAEKCEWRENTEDVATAAGTSVG
jgi:hypothetical protein